jgi:hypothetical protein
MGAAKEAQHRLARKWLLYGCHLTYQFVYFVEDCVFVEPCFVYLLLWNSM